MPIFMDRHDVSDTVNAGHVAQLHQEDLKVEADFGCKGLTYWFDDKKKMAFCLIEAPNIEAIQKMHCEAHGEIPHKIIEVDPKLVESFLGRIEDPPIPEGQGLNLISDNVQRVLLLVELKYVNFENISDHADEFADFDEHVLESVAANNGTFTTHEKGRMLASFQSAQDASECALKIQDFGKNKFSKAVQACLQLNIGLSCGYPVTDREHLFEEAVTLASRLCQVGQGEILMSFDVKTLLQKEPKQTTSNHVRALLPADVSFLDQLFVFLDESWSDTDLNMNDFSKALGLSKSQVYRKILALTGKSPNYFLRDYRLQKAVELMNNRIGNISEIAFESGFNSPAYFSKCFSEAYGVLPSSYAKQQAAVI